MDIFLDDVRPTPPGWVRCFTVKELLGIMMANYREIDVVSLDNDLGEGVPEGFTFLDKLEEIVFENPNFVLPKEIRVHSANPVARMRMRQVLRKLYPS